MVPLSKKFYTKFTLIVNKMLRRLISIVMYKVFSRNSNFLYKKVEEGHSRLNFYYRTEFVTECER